MTHLEPSFWGCCYSWMMIVAGCKLFWIIFPFCLRVLFAPHRAGHTVCRVSAARVCRASAACLLRVDVCRSLNSYKRTRPVAFMLLANDVNTAIVLDQAWRPRARFHRLHKFPPRSIQIQIFHSKSIQLSTFLKCIPSLIDICDLVLIAAGPRAFIQTLICWFG